MVIATMGSGTTAQPARPAVHSRTNTASGHPLSGSRPVQFGMAVRTNPATTACK